MDGSLQFRVITGFHYYFYIYNNTISLFYIFSLFVTQVNTLPVLIFCFFFLQ